MRSADSPRRSQRCSVGFEGMSADPDSWVMLHRDSTWEEVVMDDLDTGNLVRRCRTLSEAASTNAFGRVFDPARLQAVCRRFMKSREEQMRFLEGLWKKVKLYDDPMLVKCHVGSYEGLNKLCSSQLKLFLAGSAGSMKRSIVKAMLDIDTHDCPYSDRVTVWYRCKHTGTTPATVLVHFRQDLTEEESKDAGMHPKIREHLEEFGSSFPLKVECMTELEVILGRADAEESLEHSWEDIHPTIAIVDSLEVFIQGSDTLDAGLEMIDGPTVEIADIVATALRKQADGIIFLVDADVVFDWWPVQQALQYFARESVFVVCVSDGDEESEELAEARRAALGLGVQKSCVHVLPGVMTGHKVSDKLLIQLESSLADYLEAHAASRALELSRQVSRLVDSLQSKVENMQSLLERPDHEVRSLRTTWTPKLLKLQDANTKTLRDVRLEYARQKEGIHRMADEYFRRLADEVPEMSMKAEPSKRVGLTGAFYSSTREEYAKQVEACLRCELEDATGRWTVMHLLPAVEKSMISVEQLLGDRASGLVTELEDIKSSVWQKAERVRETSEEMRARLSALPSGLPAISTRFAAYFGVANGFRSLVAVLSGSLLGAYALLFVGALGGAVSSWLALRSAGAETEKQLKEAIGRVLSEALRRRAAETASSVASTSMEPCLACIDRYEVSFAEDLAQFMDAMEGATNLIESGEDKVKECHARCREFLFELEAAKGQLCTGQFDLIQRSNAQPR
uniref:Dynamin-type G domain-containing protein n=1 Tax=Hemiselmis andersenii TaxID=464988 RepID=A0A6U2FPX1_HEMAN|mmetsp:Transcript_33111/g.77502  ORF Transcript_33111/g.77502 Transcript_33111/m.77502 type:complete len:740 (-) Transcript_33111:63-2282(-)